MDSRSDSSVTLKKHTTTAISIVLLVLGAMLCGHGYKVVKGRASSDSATGAVVIQAHRIEFDERRWNGRKRNVIAVESRTAMGESSESLSRRFFASGESAWEFTRRHPVGAHVEISDLGNGDDFESNGRLLLFGLGLLGCGEVSILLAMTALSSGGGFLARFGTLTLFVVFLCGGIGAASSLWPVVIRSISAKWWEPVPCEIFAERDVASGKYGTRKEFAIRYSFQNVTYETVSIRKGFASKASRSTNGRLNPEKPWQFTNDWGLHPALLTMLFFPFLFLTIGLGGLVSTRFTIPKRKMKGGNTPSLLKERIERVFSVGSIGVFVATFAGFLGEIVYSLLGY